jgi:hypothetical protein
MLQSLLLVFALLSFGSVGYAEEKAESDKVTPNKIESTDDPAEEHAEYQKIVDEYKHYLTTVKSDVIKEIRDFRKEVARVNKQKHTLYKELSQEAQIYLSKERELKRKLPMKMRKLVENQSSNYAAPE